MLGPLLRTGGRNRTRTCQNREGRNRTPGGQNRTRGPFLVAGAALLTMSFGVFLCGSVAFKEMVRYTFCVYVSGVALWRGSKPNVGGQNRMRGPFLVAGALGKKWLDIPSMYIHVTGQAWHLKPFPRPVPTLNHNPLQSKPKGCLYI